MRKVAAAVTAAPVFALLIVSAILRRSLVARVGVAIGVGAVIGFGAFAFIAARPAPTAATRPVEIVPVPQGALRTSLRTDHGSVAPVEIAFTAAMNRESVRGSLSVEPPAAVRLEWSADGMVLSVMPQERWANGTYYTVTVEAGALAASGAPLLTPVRAAFATRSATTARIAPTAPAGDRVRIDTAFLVDVDRPLDPSTVSGAFQISPPVVGTWTRDLDVAQGARYLFTPKSRLAPDTAYTIALADALRDVDGDRVSSAALQVRTAAAPSVVRFRPRHGTEGVERGADLSVRFTSPMDRRSTSAAFAAMVGATPLQGRVTWAERDTVLVFDPAVELGHEQKVVLSVSTAAMSAEGVPLSQAATATFTTVPKPAPPPPPAPKPSPSAPAPTPPPASVGSGSWTAVEAYYLKLMNCTRQGGLVTSSGGCSSPGGRSVAALKLDSGISSKVARPYAKLLATRGACDHFIGGNPGDRLARAGYTSYIWAENLGCRSGDPYKAVLGSHLYFQGERSWSPVGGHYRNLMDAKYDRVGIGVWVSGGRVRLVVDFYHPR